MTLTAERKKEIWKHYDTWMQAYLNADVVTYDSYFHDDYHFIGSTNNEEFLKRKDTTEFFKVTGDQFAGLMDLRNESKILEQFNKLIFITHFCDVWFLNEDLWNYYGRFRLSSVMKQTDAGWRFIYQHFSMPDSKSDEGQTIGFENVKTENIELKEAIKRRTQELELKNRELEIESALSCIRAEATAMKKSSDLLDIVVTMRNEFIKLGHEAHYFWHMMWLPDTYEKAMTSGDGTRIGFVMTLPRHIHGDIPLLVNWEKSKKSTVVYTMDVDTAIDYVDKMVELGNFQNIDPQAPSHDDIHHIGGLTFVMARTLHGEIGYSLPGIVKNPPKKDLEILVLFAGAFDLAHRRFLDLQKAEKQAREVEIELALEKVRSRTMAMQKSEELSEASFLLDSQVRELGMNTWGCAFNIYGEEESTEWFGNEKGELNTYKVPRIGVFKDYYDKGHQGESLLIREFSGDECVEHYEFMSTLPGIGDVLKQLKKTNNGFPTYQIDHVVYFKYGYLLFITREPVPESYEVFKRFASVFEQTYTRFLDLQKAEEQAREAQIEAALEKVRSRSLAVHKSDEFNEVVSIVFEKLKELQIPATAVGIGIKIEGSKDLNSYVCGENEAGLVISNYRLPYFNNKISKDLCTAIEKELSFYVGRYTKKVKNAFYKYVLEHTNEFKDLPDDILKMIFKSSSYTISMVASKHVVFNINDFEGKALTTHEVDILKRFSKVFNQAYIRFLDLQKAEAQAREAQVEASLERVRAHSMAMHSSDELKDVIRLIFDQMKQVNINAEHAGIVVDYEPKKDFHFWVADNQDIPSRITVPYLDLVWDKQFAEAKEKGKDFFTTQLNFEEKNSFYKQLLPHIENITEEAKEFYFNCSGLSASTVLQKDIALYIENFSGTPYTEEENTTLIRFAKVFQQTYTRFLDLQKAEAQARESEIQLAMERVRASTMAMHHSKELSTVLSTLFEQFDILGINPSHAVLTLINKEKNTLTFRTTGKNGYQVYAEQEVDLNLVDNWIDTTEKWKKSNPNIVNVNEYPPEILPEVWNTYKDVLSAMPKKARPAIKDFPEGLFITEGYCLFGYIGFAHNRKPTEEEKDIVRRLAAEFGTLYQRFLDLQKTEAQAKEAQIEAALERIRSRSLAMHNSSELSAVVDTLLQEFTNLEITLTFCIINLVNEEDKSNTVWAANPETGKDSESYYMKFEDYPFHHAMWDAWKTQKKRFVYTISGKEKQVYDTYLFSDTEFKRFPKHVQEANKALERYVAAFTFSKYSGLQAVSENDISDEDLALLERFGKVFEQAYTRFLDLQKAETQAREAQIETALERLRSASMAMHKTEDISDVVFVYFEQLKELNIPFVQSWITIFHLDQAYVDVWFSPLKGIHNRPQQFQMPSALFEETSIKSWKAGLPFSYVSFPNKESVDQFMKVCDEVTASNYFGETQNKLKLQQFEMLDANHKYGCISKSNTTKATKEEEDILQRFAKVFEQTYTRFLDLQKAETQTRNAEINLAVERVRASALAMHKSEEIMKVVAKLKDEVMNLDIPDVVAATIFLNEGDDKIRMWDLSTLDIDDKNDYEVPFDITFKLKKSDPNLYVKRVWENTADYFVEIQKEKDFNRIIAWLRENDQIKIADEVEEFTESTQLKELYHAVKKLNNGKLVIDLMDPPSEEMETILSKMGAAFDLAYKRFEDLQKAEAQTQEAQIEAALEKVRSRSLAMHNTDELQEVVAVVAEKLQELGVIYDAGGVILCTYFPDNKDVVHWITVDDFSSSGRYYVPYFDNPIFNDAWNSKMNGDDYFTKSFPLAEKNDFFKQAFENSDYKQMPEDYKQFVLAADSHTLSAAWSKNSAIIIPSLTRAVPSESDAEIIKRFAKVFEQAYIRFLDLQKAEAQAREAQIEMALEKVRSRTMAMQKGEELKDVVVLLYKELIALGVTNFVSCGYVEVNEDTKRQLTWVTNPGGDSMALFYLPLTGDATFNARYKAWKAQQTVFHQTVAGKERRKHLEYAITTFQSKEAEEMVRNQFPDPCVFYCFNFSHGYLHLVGGSLLTNEEEALLARFTKVFEQTYARFLDLKKAEAQAREAQIENALEKVRSRTMAMQKSTELPEAANNLFLQVQELGIPAWSAGYCIWQDDEKHHANCNMSSEGEVQKGFILPSIGEGYNFYKPQEGGERFYVKELGGDALVRHYEFMRTLPIVGEIFDDFAKKGIELPTFQIFHIVYFKFGYVMFITYEAVPDAHDIFKRFGNVFEQTYTRFLDLERAEAQTREAQIEMALEKVRSRTMAMQHSDELAEAAQVLFSEVQALGIPSWSCGYNLLNDDNTTAQAWMSSEGIIQEPFILEFKKEPSFIEMYTFFESDNSFLVQELGGKALKRHYKYMKSIPSLTERFENFEKEGIALPTYQINHLYKFSKGYLLFITYEKVPEAHDIFKRFTSVFEQTYTRFLDLKDAEARARESKIQAALERVRSQSMGMQSTNDFAQVTTEMFNQLRNFGEDLFATGIVFCDKHKGHVEQWHSIPGGGMLSPMIVPVDLDYIHQYRYDQWKAGNELFSIEIPSDFIKQHFEDIFKLPSAQITLKDLESRNAPMPAAPPWEIDYGASFNKGYILISSLKPLENTDILPRFAQVFEQAYTRFLDLQKAEEQAKEAQIEAALEKVRSRTLAMQKSEELAETSVVVFKELLALGIEPNRLFIGIIKDNGDTIDAWATNEDGSKIKQQFKLHTSKNKSIKKMVEGWKQQQKSTIIDMKGKELQAYFHYLNDVMQIPFIDGLKQKRRVQTITYFSGGLIGMAASEEQPEETINLLERFAAVFNLTYTRFNDLKISESQTRKAKIETALERVRARALAMQEPEELKEVASVLRTEMGLLGIEELETCSIYILEDDISNAECWYALKDAKSKTKKLISDHISMDFTKTWVGEQMFNFHDSENETTSIVMKGAHRKEWIHYCAEQSKVLQSYYGEEIPERTYHLQKFSNGAIGAASAGDISEESWVLLERCASVFSLAYSRFKGLTQAKIDLKRLKVEKKRAEEALSELQTTQKQLVQSEKMASLGELTAGIAHEIQNPLNFVNNFSEVSKELLEEMQEEIENGDFEEVKAIMVDVIQNLDKINHHGKRADGIVKGMLQHSRASGDKKEPTDINALSDEYLRLAYHGLRAKDKSFNAELVTDFDDSIKSVMVVPQDVGRVILNLLTNAFYVVNEKKKMAIENYKPTVSISTKKKKGMVEIRVTDNGNGIPDAVKEKIFQPFFTTKPTGEGTGLGLSLSYDIITKGHGGDLKVVSKEGEGTTFTIEIPHK